LSSTSAGLYLLGISIAVYLY